MATADTPSPPGSVDAAETAGAPATAAPPTPAPPEDGAPEPTTIAQGGADHPAPAPAEDDIPEPRVHDLFPQRSAQRIYLDLMNMGSADGLLQCERLVRASENPRVEAYLLLESADWRRKLVGVCWLLYHDMDRAARTLLWRAADGSWISPQAAAVAFLLDRLFRSEAEQRLRAARGAGRPLSKALGALAGLYERCPDGAPGMKTWLRAEAEFLPEGEWARGFAVSWAQRVGCLAPQAIKRAWVRWP